MVHDNVCGSYAMLVVVLIVAKSFDCVMFNICIGQRLTSRLNS